MNFFGYLLTTPFVSSGDLGKVAVLLALPPALTWAVFSVGVAGVLAVGAGATRPLLELASGPLEVTEARRRARVIFQIAILPWWLGGLFAALVSYPSSHWFSYAYDVFAGFFLIGTWRRAARVTPPVVRPEQWADAAPWPWSLALVGMVAAVLVLHDGVSIGW